MSQHTYVNFYYTLHVHNLLNSHISSISIFNELNFSYWNKQVQFYLDEKSNKLNLMFIRMIVVDSIKTSLPKIESAKEFIGLMEERFQKLISLLLGH
ncbi:hypothetical protein CR513_46185, partial [Mucuna pruriens]